MKIRTGFVSNSSTSSFCIFGVALYPYKVKKMLSKNIVENDDDEDEDEDEDCLYEEIDRKARKSGLEFHSPDGWDMYYIGVAWDSIGDNETGAQFKSRVASLLAEFFGQKVSCSTYQEAWHD